ncbi:hypothetical protein ACFL4Z_02995 [candidate division KSB1 bacterium]
MIDLIFEPELLWLLFIIVLTIPTVEFRALDITETEPSDRTTAGSVVSQSSPLDFGTANNTAGAVNVGPKCIIFRCSNLQGNTTISNMKFWLSSNFDFVGNNLFYCDINNTWTQNKTVGQVSGGTPGLCPTSTPSANVTKIGGGDITGIGHADTSQYLYLAMNIRSDEIIGTKGGAGGAFGYSMKFDFS